MPEGITCCPKNHFGYLESGKMKVVMVETGEEKVINAGEVYHVPPKVSVTASSGSQVHLLMYRMLYIFIA